jgi:hypothetical protein
VALPAKSRPAWNLRQEVLLVRPDHMGVLTRAPALG